MSETKTRGINFGSPGRMISFGKQAPAGHLCVWNANVCTRSGGKIWFGDLDLNTDEKDLLALAAKLGEQVYVLRESDARFTTEAAPRFENAVRIYTPDGHVRLEESPVP